MAAHDTGEGAGGEGWGEEHPCSGRAGRLFDKEATDGSLGDLVAFVEKEDFVEAFGACAGQLFVVEVAVGGLVAEEGIGGVCAVGAERDGDGRVLRGRRGLIGLAGIIAPTRPQVRVRMGVLRGRRELDWIEGMGGDGCGAVGREEEADAVALAGVEEVGKGSELGFYGGAVADEVEVGGGGLETIKVEREARIVLVEEDGFDELEGLVGAGEERGFEEGFAVLVCGDGVGDDAAAYSHVGFAVLEDQGADGYAEGCAAVGGDETDGAGVDAAGMGFEVADDLHGADLGGSGDRAAGEHGGEDVVEGCAGAEGGGDGGGHLEEGLVALDGEEIVDVDGAREGDAAEVVAEEVDDHYVLGAILFVVLEG